MHIPDGLISQPVCVVTSGLAAAGLAWAVQNARQSATPDKLKLMPAVAATIFAGQMLNFSVGGGMSGHLIGAVLATVLLGPALAMISMGAVILAQCLLLGDGGVTALGANFLSMGVVGVLVADFVWNKLRSNVSEWASVGIASWASVVGGSVACTAALIFSGTGSLSFASAMVANHSLLGLAEAGMTIGAILAIRNAGSVRRQISTLACIAVSLFVMVPFASALPDGLEAALAGTSHTSTFAIGLTMSVVAVMVAWHVRLNSARKLAVQRIRR